MKVTRRELLGAAALAVGVRTTPITLAIASDVSGAVREGAAFGLAEAARAATLMGRPLQQDAGAALVIRGGPVVDASGTRFDLRDDPDAYAAALAAARAAAAPGATLQAVEWHHSLVRYGASELNDRFALEQRGAMSSAHWLGWMAVKVAVEASLRARAGESVAAAIARLRFDGHKGRGLTFSPATRRLRQPLYVIDTGKDIVIWPEM